MTTTPDSTAVTLGIHHLGLTVPDVRAAADFFIDGLGFNQVAERPAYPAIFVSDGAVMLTLWQADAAEPVVAFDRRHNLGLHHVALRVADADALGAVHTRLAARSDVTIEFAPEAVGDGPTQHMMCRIPGNLRVEFIAPAA